jgi:hypothetical protein
MRARKTWWCFVVPAGHCRSWWHKIEAMCRLWSCQICSDTCQKDHIVGCNTKRSAIRERLNYVTKFYSSSLKAVMRATAPSVCYRYRSIQTKLFWRDVVVKWYVMAAVLLTSCERVRDRRLQYVHSVGI